MEDSEPSDRDRDRYSEPGEVGPWVRRASAPVPVHSPRHAGLGLVDPCLGPGECGWVAIPHGEKWSPLLQGSGLCLSGTKGAR